MSDRRHPPRASRILLALALLCLPAASKAEPSRPVALLELFTSQGCSSCPAADALFAKLAQDGKYLPLTFPVTYWDYLGWKDTLAQDAFTKRQKLYAKARGDGQVYTPQAVVNGVNHVVGSDQNAIERGVLGSELRLAVSARREGDEILVSLPDSVPVEASVWILPVRREITVPIGKGENSGRTVTYANVVRGLVRLGDWKGSAATLEAPLATTRIGDADAYAVIVQSGVPSRYGQLPGTVLGATLGSF